MFDFVLLKQSRSDFIERLFYLKTMYNIYLLDIIFCIQGGYLKLIRQTGNAANPIADSSTDFLQNFTLSISSKYPQKSSKITIFPSQTTYRTPYRQIPLKSSISATSQPKNQTLIPPKIYPQFQNLPYLQTLLPITFFHLKIAKSSLTTLHIQGVLKNYTQNHSNKRITI